MYALDRNADAQWTLEQLVDQSTAMLRRLRVRSDDGRTSGTPDARLVRYYQTLGLLDKPLRYDGRRAVYGFRHLLQLLAIKRLQEEGHPLHLIQSALAGKTNAQLRAALVQVANDASPPPHVNTVTIGGHDAAQDVAAQSVAAEESFITSEIAPGVILTIDARRVVNPSALLAAARRAVQTHLETRS